MRPVWFILISDETGLCPWRYSVVLFKKGLTMKSKILWALSHAEGYVSGQELCELFQVSRTAVWKVINQLKEEGYEFKNFYDLL